MYQKAIKAFKQAYMPKHIHSIYSKSLVIVHTETNVRTPSLTGEVDKALPVHSELCGDPVEAQRHKRHVCDAFIGARRWPLLYRSLQETKVHLQERKTKQKQSTKPDWTEPHCAAQCCWLKITDAVDINNSDAHKKLFRKINYRSTGERKHS